MKTQRYGSVLVALALVIAQASCRSSPDAGFIGIQIMEDADRRSSAESLPERSAIFDGTTVRLVAARGETVAITVWQGKVAAARVARQAEAPNIEEVSRSAAPVTLRFADAGAEGAAGAPVVSGFEVEWLHVVRPSTRMYGGSRGAAWYPDALSPSPAPRTDPAFLDIAVSSDAAPGLRRGELRIGARAISVELTVSRVISPPIGASPRVWAYYDPRELAWHRGVSVDSETTFRDEARCAAMFRAHGVMATPEVVPSEWERRKAQVAGAPYVPVLLPQKPDEMSEAVRFWQQALSATGQRGFAIPIDEPRDDARRREVVALGEALQRRRPSDARLLLAVTDVERKVYGKSVDIFISPRAISRREEVVTPPLRWTYNGNPPYAGSMVVDAGNGDLRTWGWIGFRWDVPLWYVWDALYWHDRHNAKRAGLPRPGRAMATADAVTFDDGGDQGNRDGVLAVPGVKVAARDDDAAATAIEAPLLQDELPCRPTLRLKALRRGLFDRALLDVVSRCGPADQMAAAIVPFALGDAFSAAWRPPSPNRWSQARLELLEIAARCTP